MEVKTGSFKEVLELKNEGIVLLGAGGDPQEWIEGITQELQSESIIEEDTLPFEEAIKLTSTGGRTDLVLTFNPHTKIDLGKMAMWRLRFGDCSWISDFVVNYAKHY